MAGGRLYGAATSNLGTLFQSQRVPCVSQPLDPFLLSGSSSSPFLGSRSMMSFEDVNRGGGGGGSRLKRSMIFPFDQDEYGDEDLDEYFHQPEKKRRLSAVQVQSLEKHFKLDNKLEPERKVQLAKDLGLQPRQVAIWFQNRRARWKTKQLEKDYGVLQASFDSLKADFDILVKEHDQLKSEVNLLTDRLLLEEKERVSSGLSDANNLFEQPPQIPIMDSASEDEVSKNSAVACKPEDLSSTRSDTLDSDSSHNNDGGHSCLLEHGDHSSHGFEPDHSDSSHDEDENLSNTLLPQYIFPKLEEADYSDPPSNSCSYGFPAEDNAFWSWSY